MSKPKFNILVVDDEELARNFLKDVLEELLSDQTKFNSSCIVYEMDNRLDVVDFISKKDINIVFFDVNMSGKSGIDLAREVSVYKQKYNKKVPVVCFVTGYDKYALDAFGANAFDYILKPINDTKLLNFFSKVENFDFNYSAKYLVAPINGIDVKVNFEDIFYLQADGKYMSINMAKKVALTLDSISRIEKEYDDFIRVHRSYLVNKDYIDGFFKEDNQVYVKLKVINKAIPVSRRQKSELEGKLNIKIFDDKN